MGVRMAIEVIRKNGRTKIVGSETYPNGMTMTFIDPDGGCGRKYCDHNPRHYGNIGLLDIHHARSWFAGNRPSKPETTEVGNGRKVESLS